MANNHHADKSHDNLHTESLCIEFSLNPAIITA